MQFLPSCFRPNRRRNEEQSNAEKKFIHKRKVVVQNGNRANGRITISIEGIFYNAEGKMMGAEEQDEPQTVKNFQAWKSTIGVVDVENKKYINTEVYCGDKDKKYHITNVKHIMKYQASDSPRAHYNDTTLLVNQKRMNNNAYKPRCDLSHSLENVGINIPPPSQTNHTIKNYNAKVENSSLNLRVPETVTKKNPFQKQHTQNIPMM